MRSIPRIKRAGISLRNKRQTDNTITLKVELYNDSMWKGWQ